MSEKHARRQKEPEADDVEWAEKLDSGEINNLLGFDLSAEAGEDRSGLRALINSALVSHRRLPMLDVVFDRAARLMTTNLRQLTNDNVEVALDDVSSTRFGDFLHSTPTPCVIGVIKAPSFENYFLLAVDASLVYSIVDLLLGGRRGGSVLTIDERGFTPIELALTQRVIDLLASDLFRAFAPIMDVPFVLDRIETTPRFAAIAQEASVCSLGKFRIDIEDRGGRAAILMPHATLEPVHKQLQREFIGEAANEEDWRAHLAAEVDASKLDLKVVVADREMTIGELGRLRVGETVVFPGAARPEAQIRAGEAIVARGRVGRSGDCVAVRLQGGAMRPKDERAA